jgi:hypothetical protein
MSVNITWSLTDGGADIVDPLDHGSAAPGNTLESDLYISHDGDNAIKNCKFFLQEYSGTYTGSDSAANDLSTILGFGDSTTATKFGGFMINQDATGSFAGTWPTYDDHDQSYASVMRNNMGDSLANGVTLISRCSSGMVTDGVIPASCSPTPHIKTRIVVLNKSFK